MAKRTRAGGALSPPAVHALTQLGYDIRVARKRRGISIRSMAERMLVSQDTVQRLEKGEPGVSLQILVSALLVLGLESRLAGLLDPASDSVGEALTLEKLPERIHDRDAKGPSDMDF